MTQQNQETSHKKQNIFNNNNQFYYCYRCDNEKRDLQKIICKDLTVFHKTVCLYEKNKDNPNCGDLSEYLKVYCNSYV